MNFWTFLDRNSEGAWWVVVIAVIALAVAVPLTVHELRAPVECKPCVCGPVAP